MIEGNKSQQSSDDEIDLREFVAVIWRGKWIILAMMFLFGLSSIFYAIDQPNIYKSEVLLAPVEQDQSLGGLQAQLGGLASFAGISLGSGSSNKSQLAIEILKSRNFVSNFIKKYNILPDLMAVESWNVNTNTIAYDQKLYDPKTKIWVRDVSLPYRPKPSELEAYKAFMERFNVTNDTSSGMVTLSFEHWSPSIAQAWLNLLVEDINHVMKSRDVEQAERSSEYLSTQLSEIQITDMREILYKLVEEQAKTIMFANVTEEYVFKTIDPAFLPEEKAGPNRVLICILGTLLGGMLGALIVLFGHFRNSFSPKRAV